MHTQALRLYGKNDLRLERFELPALEEDQILAEVVSNSVCMSSHKAALQGAGHKRVPDDVAEHPIIIGHEFCGTLLEVGARWADRFRAGQRFTVQPALNVAGRELEAPGYSFRWIGGNATRILIPREVMEQDCLLVYEGDAFFGASLSEPVSCIVGAFNTQYHFRQGQYAHRRGIVEGGCMALLAGAGPMGLGAIDYTLHGPRQPRLLVVTDIDQARLDRAASVCTPQSAAARGVDLRYLNTGEGDTIAALKALTGGKGYDDVFVFAPVPALLEQASRVLGFNGCLNFFAGPSRKDFFASVNFYDVHYMGHHIVGSSGGNTDDMREALELMAAGKINPAAMVTHVGGLDCVADTIRGLPEIPGGKKLIYTQRSMPLMSLSELGEGAAEGDFAGGLAEIVKRHNGLWSADAERYVLSRAPSIENT